VGRRYLWRRREESIYRSILTSTLRKCAAANHGIILRNDHYIYPKEIMKASVVVNIHSGTNIDQLHATIGSVLDQEYGVVELIIVVSDAPCMRRKVDDHYGEIAAVQIVSLDEDDGLSAAEMQAQGLQREISLSLPTMMLLRSQTGSLNLSRSTRRTILTVLADASFRSGRIKTLVSSERVLLAYRRDARQLRG